MAPRKEYSPLDGVSDEAPFSPPRAPLRAAPDDARARADARMAELRQLHGDSLADEGTDKFYIDRSIIPDGWDYEWKRHTLLNKEDPAYEVALRRAGWEPVPAGRHPEMMPLGTRPDVPITQDGNMLMERPLELSDMARARDFRRARDQVRVKEQQLNEAPHPGQFERHNRGTPLASVKKSMVPMPVPE